MGQLTDCFDSSLCRSPIELDIRKRNVVNETWMLWLDHINQYGPMNSVWDDEA